MQTPGPPAKDYDKNTNKVLADLEFCSTRAGSRYMIAQIGRAICME